MQRITLGALALACACTCGAQTSGAGPQISGQVRLQWDQRQANATGPLAVANELAAGTASTPGNGATLETELRSSGSGWNASATLQQQMPQGLPTQSRTWVNELVATHDGGSWQFSAGKKIVAWDVGYAFRPNDVVQQGERRTLTTTLTEGRPVLMAEHFDADTAWSWVWVNPTAASDAQGAKEPALAARVYRRDGSLDWHGFARLGAHTGASVGAALAWVASDALELHGSLRYLERADSLTIAPQANGLVGSQPWQTASVQRTAQALVGGTWTHESQLSVLAEAWWDGAALSDAQWDAWSERNAQLAVLATRGVPAAAVAGNLVWQSQAFSVAQNLRRSNLFVRLSWQHEGWQPALDLLYTPVDHGRVWTASLSWQGDRVTVQGGLRAYGGPVNALLAQLPTRSQAYLASTWAF